MISVLTVKLATQSPNFHMQNRITMHAGLTWPPFLSYQSIFLSKYMLLNPDFIIIILIEQYKIQYRYEAMWKIIVAIP